MSRIKKIVIFGNIFVLCLMLITFLVIFLVTKKQIIGFYNIPTENIKIFTNIIEENISDKFEYFIFDSLIPLSSQLKSTKCSMIFTITDSDTKEFAQQNKHVKTVSKDLLNGMPFSIQKQIPTENNEIFYVPFLYDMYQIDVNFDFLNKIDFSVLNLWEDLLNIAIQEKSITKSPIVFPIADDCEFLNIFGQLIECFSSPKEYEDLYNELYQSFKTNQNEKITEVFQNHLSSQNGVFKTLIQLINLQENQLISNDVFFHSKQDCQFFVENELCGIYFTTLQNHREISRDVIKNYRTIYFPSDFEKNERKFAAKEYSMILFKQNELTTKILQDFSQNLQQEISTKTGLAPVQKNIPAPDVQSDDVRYWLAASSGPMLPLSSSLPSKNAQRILADEIRNVLK